MNKKKYWLNGIGYLESIGTILIISALKQIEKYLLSFLFYFKYNRLYIMKKYINVISWFRPKYAWSYIYIYLRSRRKKQM